MVSSAASTPCELGKRHCATGEQEGANLNPSESPSLPLAVSPAPSVSTTSGNQGSGWYTPGGTALIVLFTIAATLAMVVAYHQWARQ